MSFGTEQEHFWAGEFGNDYADRNRGPEHLAANLVLWGRILSHSTGITSVLELGANIGMNLRALKQLLPKASLAAVEINSKACKSLREIGGVDVAEASLLAHRPTRPVDLAFVSGVLIHLAPERLPDAYDVLAAASARYVVIAEYYNPTPVELTYRGHEGRLFKRDFAGEFVERHPFRLVEYGFTYRRDPNFAFDDLTWFLLERK